VQVHYRVSQLRTHTRFHGAVGDWGIEATADFWDGKNPYLVTTADAVEGPPVERPDIDIRFSAFFIIVFILVSILVPLLSFLGTVGSPCAGELILSFDLNAAI